MVIWMSELVTLMNMLGPVVAFDADLCILCNQCRIVCPIGAVTFDGDDRIIRDKCDSCGDCAVVCPSGALTQPET